MSNRTTLWLTADHRRYGRRSTSIVDQGAWNARTWTIARLRVPVDDQGRMIASRMPSLNGASIVCIQAGNANTGAFDPAEDLCARAHESGAMGSRGRCMRVMGRCKFTV